MGRYLFLALLMAPAWSADAGRGRDLIQREGCLTCHSVNGEGAGHEANLIGPDLANRLATTYTPAALASAIWNHTPAMWEEARAQRLAQPSATAADWADMFAYLYSLQFAERPAEVRRGRSVLTEKRCLDCHSASGSAPVPEKWASIDDPVALVYQMWSHAPAMARRSAEYKKDWAKLDGDDFRDLTAYLQTLRNQPRSRSLNLPAPGLGKAPFDAACANCHRGTRALNVLLRNETWMDIGAGMWNHAPRMVSVPPVSEEEMRGILAYVWELQYQGTPGRTAQGQRTFGQKGCGTCHADAKALASKVPDPFAMVASTWGPARDMHRQLSTRGKTWPQLSAADVANLGAYFDSLRR